jgi:hypothetical protein
MGEARVEHLAALAVLAGCPASSFPVLVAAVEAAAQDPFNLLAVTTTTGNVAVAVIVSGPGVGTMRFHPGSNGLGAGPRTNVTLGRALRLVLMNVGGATPGLLDVACLGWPGKLSFCVAEHQAASPWPSFAVERGFREQDTVVTVMATFGFLEMADAVSAVADDLLGNLAGMMTCCLASGSRGDEALVLLTPQHAHILADAGFSRRRTQEALAKRLEELQHALPPTRGAEVSGPLAPDRLLLLVTGANGGKSACVPGWSASLSISVAVP